MDIIEGNKIIAEFMGFENENQEWRSPYPTLSYKIEDRWYPCHTLKFHSSLDWLMPVVEKIKDTNVNIGSRFEYDQAGTTIIISLLPPYEVEMWNETGWHYKEQGVVLINEVWKAATQFIQWYNTQTK